jgi:hypothetical protein
MLLEMTEDEEAKASADSALEGSTIMDAVKSPGDDTTSTRTPYRPTPAKPASSGNTSSAAKDILEKYRRRPRT